MPICKIKNTRNKKSTIYLVGQKSHCGISISLNQIDMKIKVKHLLGFSGISWHHKFFQRTFQRKPSVEISLKERSVKISLKKIVKEPPIDQESTNQTNTTSCNPALNEPKEVIVMQKPNLDLRVDNISKGRKLGSNRKKPAIYNQDQNI